MTCDRNDTLHHAFTLFAAAGGRAERVICVDAARRVTGVVSLSDIFSWFAQADEIPPTSPGMVSRGSGVFFGGQSS